MEIGGIFFFLLASTLHERNEMGSPVGKRVMFLVVLLYCEARGCTFFGGTGSPHLDGVECIGS